MTSRRTSIAFVCLAAWAVPAWSGWSANPAANTPIAAKTSDQVQPKIRPTSDGGCYVSWFDNDPTGSPAFGYDVYLQRLDASGNLLWAPGGVRIADLGHSSTEDYGLDVDASDNALLAFLDDRSGFDQVTVQKVSPAGALLWGAGGVQVTTDTTATHSSPKVTATSDGFVVAAWTHGNDVRLQKLASSNGAIQWTAGGVILKAPTNNTFGLCDVHGGDAGSVVVSFVWTVAGSRHLAARKLSSAAATLWSAVVYDGGSLQFGNFPPFVPDGSGGGVFGWYSVSPLESHAQHILSAGTEAFPHNGVVPSTDTTHSRVDPAVAWNAATSETFLVWDEQSGSLSGIYGQKFDSAGTRKWGSTGAVLLPLGTDSLSQIEVNKLGAGVAAFWVSEATFGQDILHAATLDGFGAFVCAPFAASSVLSPKSRLDASIASGSMSIVAWSDGRADGGDIYGQNVNSDCSLGLVLPKEVSPPGALQPLILSDKVTLVWEDKSLSGSTSFDLYRGLLTDLALGLFGDCLQSGLTSSVATDSAVPSTDTGFFYLVAGRNANGEGPLGSSTSGPRAPHTPCP